MIRKLLRAFAPAHRGVRCADKWPFHMPLFRWSKSEVFTVGESMEGILCLGQTGSGKTTGLAETVALGMLRTGYGGFVSSFKGEEKERWKEYSSQTHRSRDLIIFGPDQPWRFNFLDYEVNRGGRGAGMTENIVNLLTIALEIAENNSNRSSGGQEDGTFWERTNRQVCRNAVDLLILSLGKVTIPDLYKLIVSAPTSLAAIADAGWQARSFCFQCLLKAEKQTKTPSQKRDFDLAANFFLEEFATLSDRTRSVIVATFTSMIDMLNRGLGRELLCTETNVTPEAMEEGRVVFADLPIAEFGPLGKLIQGILRHSFQLGIQRREIRRSPRPVFFFADEFQAFVSSYDNLFQSTCRSARVASVYLSQNVPNIVAALGGGQKGKAECDSLFGNLNLKVFNANSDPVTNEYAANLIGRTKQFFMNGGASNNPDDWTSTLLGFGASSTNGGFSEAMEYEVQPSEFANLRTGGRQHARQIDALVFRSGRPFQDTGRNWRYATFQQRRR